MEFVKGNYVNNGNLYIAAYEDGELYADVTINLPDSVITENKAYLNPDTKLGEELVEKGYAKICGRRGAYLLVEFSDEFLAKCLEKFTFQVITKDDNVQFFETYNYTEGCIIVGAMENIKCIRVWDGKDLIRDERR